MSTAIRDEEAPKRLGVHAGHQIRDARMAKGWTMKQLAGACNVKKNVVVQYESGRAVLDPTILAKMKRVLGIRKIKKKPKSKVVLRDEYSDKLNREMMDIIYEPREYLDDDYY